jgi:4-azaleucine resistance transporter AzlC
LNPPAAQPVSACRRALQGAKDVSPILLGVIPFGMIAGASAINAGFSTLQAMSMSVVIFAGASQLAAIDLLARGAAVPVVVLTVLVINLRFIMYSAALTPHFSHLPTRWKALVSYLLTDQAFVVAVNRYEAEPRMTGRRWYYLGTAMILWITWQFGTAAGVFLGTLVPASWELDFTVPLVFVALLVPTLDDRGNRVAALVAGGVALAGQGLPYNLGLILAAFAGIALARWVEIRHEAPSEVQA